MLSGAITEIAKGMVTAGNGWRSNVTISRCDELSMRVAGER